MFYAAKASGDNQTCRRFLHPQGNRSKPFQLFALMAHDLSMTWILRRENTQSPAAPLGRRCSCVLSSLHAHGMYEAHCVLDVVGAAYICVSRKSPPIVRSLRMVPNMLNVGNIVKELL